MTDKTSLGDRMKQYEVITQSELMRRTPVIIRVDGRAFHTLVPKLFNEGVDPSLLTSPFSVKLHETMTAVTCALFNQIQNSVFAYTQSDEVSLLLRDWDKHETQQWFGGNIQKIVSVSASIATAMFNYFSVGTSIKPEWFGEVAQFDSRVFNVPKEEVVNYFVWRQQDASRNSVQQLARFYFSHKQLHKKNNSEIQDMLMEQHKVNWNNLPTWQKRGSCVYTNPTWSMFSSLHRAYVDEECPIFTQDRSYVEKWLTADSQPGLPKVGDGWRNTETGEFKVFDGDNWVDPVW